MAATIVAAAIAAGVGIYGMIKKNKEKKKAAEEYNKVQESKYTIPNREYETSRLLESLSQRGLGAKSREVAMQGFDRGLASAINAIQISGGSPSDVTKAYRAYNNSVDRLAIIDQEQQLRNISMMLQQRQRLTDLETARWQINEYAPAKDKKAFFAQQYAQADAGQKQAMASTVGSLGALAGGVSRMNTTNKAQGGTGFLHMNKSGNAGQDAYLNIDNSSVGLYSPASNSYINQMNFERVRPELRGTLYQMLNSPYYNSAKTA